MNYWLIQYNPKKYDTIGAGLDFEEDNWHVSSDKLILLL